MAGATDDKASRGETGASAEYEKDIRQHLALLFYYIKRPRVVQSFFVDSPKAEMAGRPSPAKAGVKET